MAPATSTLEASSMFCWTLAPFAARTAPLAAPARNCESPIGCRPLRAGTSTILILPSARPLAETLPSAAIFTSAASVPFGRVIGGSSSDPVEVTMRPCPSRLKSPSRVRAVRPSGSLTWKKPGPLIASESGLSTCCCAPSAKSRPSSTAAAPAPIPFEYTRSRKPTFSFL